MGQILAVVTINKVSALPADAVQNAFTFTTGTVPPSAAELNEISNSLQNFYSANGSLGSPVAHWFPSSVDGGSNRSTIEFYDLTGHLDGSPHGSPIRTDHFTLAGVGGTDGLPDEVAVVMSYGSDVTGLSEEVGVTRPKARHRGRIYLGPITISAINYDGTTHEAFITPNLRTTIIDAAVHLMEDPALVTWTQWSRANAALNPVIQAMVDNAWDIQRRRGVKATTRTLS